MIKRKTDRQLIVEIAKKWPGHKGVNWKTTRTESLLLLIADAVDGTLSVLARLEAQRN